MYIFITCFDSYCWEEFIVIAQSILNIVSDTIHSNLSKNAFYRRYFYYLKIYSIDSDIVCTFSVSFCYYCNIILPKMRKLPLKQKVFPIIIREYILIESLLISTIFTNTNNKECQVNVPISDIINHVKTI